MTSGDLVEPSLPASFGRYTLLDRLGAGGMADVFLAMAKGAFDTKKLVVVKRPRATSSEHVGMFMDEARLAMRLNHPNVVQTYDVGVEGGAFFLAMEYLDGQPLHRVISALGRHGETLSHSRIARIGAEALAGLHYAHELTDYDGTRLDIVHRDVSPHNVFVTYEGQIKVVDFGIAKATVNQAHTETGSIKGKLAYMAPEHALGQAVDRRADVFAMGVIVWELVARRRLVTGATSAQLLNQLLTMEFPPLSCEVPTVHPILEAVVMRALQREPSDRYATALEMREALESYIAITNEPVRASDLGRTLESLFAEAREQMSTRIRAHMQASAASSSSASSSSASSSSGSSSSDGARMPTAVTSVVDMGSAGGDTNGPAVVTSPAAGPRAEWRTTAAVLVLALSILVLAGALLLTRSAPLPAPEKAAATAREADAPAPAASITPASTSTSTSTSTSASTSTTTPPLSDVRDASVAPVRPVLARPAASSRPAARPIDTSFPR